MRLVAKTEWKVKREVEGEVKGEELKEALHPQRVLIRGSYAEPVGEAGGGGEAHLLEQGDGGLVFHAHADIDLMEVEDMAGRMDQSADGPIHSPCGGIRPARPVRSPPAGGAGRN